MKSHFFHVLSQGGRSTSIAEESCGLDLKVLLHEYLKLPHVTFFMLLLQGGRSASVAEESYGLDLKALLHKYLKLPSVVLFYVVMTGRSQHINSGRVLWT